jgi:menaquinone-dependent protoporphyrinogen oxidase
MHVLVAVASRHGSTREIANAIAQHLQLAGVHAEVRPVEEVASLETYDAVVLGSALYMGNWDAAANRFVQRHQSRLLTVPVWLFSSGPVGNTDDAGPGDPPQVVEIGRRTHARGVQLFAGKLDRHQLNLGERLIVNVVHAPDGDFRDWSAIRAWAEEIGAALTSAVVSGRGTSTLSDAPNRSRRALAQSG